MAYHAHPEGYSYDEMLQFNDFQVPTQSGHYNDFALMGDLTNTSAPVALPETVSPNDTLIDPYSAPPSGAFTNFSTPATSAFDSPHGFTHSTDPSPLFSDESFGDGAADNFPPLFPEHQEDLLALDAAFSQGPRTSHTAPPMARNASSAIEDIHSAAAAHSARGPTRFDTAPPMSRNPSSATDLDHTTATYDSESRQTSMAAPPMSRDVSTTGHQSAQFSRPSVHPSTWAGIEKPQRPQKIQNSKQRKKNSNLPPIPVDPNDPEGVRRARNTMAARKSRDKRAALIDSLTEQVEYYRNIALSLGHVEEE
ncbi:hypothetical protein P7C71_g6457, partial [Lecanoromycetidae sp. Uapishka_2]